METGAAAAAAAAGEGGASAGAEEDEEEAASRLAWARARCELSQVSALSGKKRTQLA